MTIEFKRNQEVYDKYGNVYIYNQSLPDQQHLVSEILRIQSNFGDGDFEENTEEGQLQIKRQIFENPPIKMVESDVYRVSNELKVVKNALSQAESDLRHLKGSISSHQKRLEARIAEYPHYEKILKLLEGKQPRYGIHVDDFHVYDSETPKKITFDMRNGKIKYEEWFSCETANYILFYELSEAQEWFKANATKQATDLEDSRLDQIISNYKKLDLKIPPSLIDSRLSRIKEKKELLEVTQKEELTRLSSRIMKMENDK